MENKNRKKNIKNQNLDEIVKKVTSNNVLKNTKSY